MREPTTDAVLHSGQTAARPRKLSKFIGLCEVVVVTKIENAAKSAAVFGV